jgi:hypothetical protein
MAYSEFTFQKLETDLQLTLEEANLYATIPAVEVRRAFVDILEEHVPLALSINTEKARSELIIAPALVELRKVLGHKISLFSGVEFNIDPQKGLNGVCDFIISASPKQLLITTPIINVVEAKNENIKGGIPQCIAVMYGTQVFNRQKNLSTPAIYGVVTTGSSWKFMQLQESVVTIDSMEYFIDSIGKIMGILLHMASPSSP